MTIDFYLNLVEEEWELPGDRAVQSGLEVGGPVLREDVLAANVALANAGNAGVNGLLKKKETKHKFKIIYYKTSERRFHIWENKVYVPYIFLRIDCLTFPQLRYSTAVSRKKKYTCC